MTKQIAHTSGHAGLIVPRAEDHSIISREHDGTGTHRTGLERYVQRAAAQSPISNNGTRSARRQQFRMSGGIAITDGTIRRAGDDRSPTNNDGAHGYLIRGLGFTRLSERLYHPWHVARPRLLRHRLPATISHDLQSLVEAS